MLTRLGTRQVRDLLESRYRIEPSRDGGLGQPRRLSHSWSIRSQAQNDLAAAPHGQCQERYFRRQFDALWRSYCADDGLRRAVGVSASMAQSRRPRHHTDSLL